MKVGSVKIISDKKWSLHKELHKKKVANNSSVIFEDLLKDTLEKEGVKYEQ